MDKPSSKRWTQQGSSTQQGNSAQRELKDDTVVISEEVSPDVYVSDTDIKSYINTSDSEIFEETENSDLRHDTPFGANGSINAQSVTQLVDSAIHKRFGPALPDASALAAVRAQIVHQLPEDAQDPNIVFKQLLAIPQAVSSAKLSDHYYGFISGGTLPIAEAANSLVGAMDLNMLNYPYTSVAVDVEAATLEMLLQVLDLPEEQWRGRTLTSGATGSNILGLAVARDTLINELLASQYHEGSATIASEGLLSACAMVGIKNVKILSQKSHSSIYKAAGILGLGRGCVIECGLIDEPWRWDWEKVKAELADDSAVCIAVVSCGEVDTGRYGSFSNEYEGDMLRLRSLLDATRSRGWIHVDGAFGIFARALPEDPEFLVQRSGVAGLEHADSICADAHKCLNVPYESGLFFTRHAQSLVDVCSNGSAAYLAFPPVGDIISPLNTSMENSRRFRALPIYAVLLNLGRSGLARMFASQILLARTIAKKIHDEYEEHFELLPLGQEGESWKEQLEQIGMIVLFRAKDEELNKDLTDRINAIKRIFVSGTSFDGRKAVRIAISGWNVNYSMEANGDAAVVCGVFDEVLKDWKVQTQKKLKHKSATTVTEKDLVDRSENELEMESEPFPIFNLASFTEQPATVDDMQNTQLSAVSNTKRPSIVYVSTTSFASAVSVPKSEAEQMRRAFDLGVPSFLEADVGLDGGLEPRFTSVPTADYIATSVAEPRSERDRERARILSPRSVHSPLAVHTSRSPIAPCSPLLEPEVRFGEVGEVVWMKKEEKVVKLRSAEEDSMSLTENVRDGVVRAPYEPGRMHGARGSVGSPRSVPSILSPSRTLDALD